MINNLSKFLKFELRNKLRIIENKFNFKIYPHYIKNNFIDKIKFKVILYLTLNEKLKKVKKYYINNICSDLNKKHNCIITFPRSGTHYVQTVIKSYYEIFLDIGAGNVKYDNIKDNYYQFTSSLSEIFNFHNGINFSHNFNLSPEQKKKYNMDIKFAGHFPLGDINTVYLENISFVVVVRKQIEKSISSLYLYRANHQKHHQKIDHIFLNKIIDEYLFFENFWRENKLNLNYKMIYYEDLCKDPFFEFSNIFDHYNIEYSKEILSKAIKLNHIDEHKKIIPKSSKRVTNTKYTNLREEIELYIKHKLKL